MWIEKLNIPGEHAFESMGACGKLEAILSLGPKTNPAYMAILGHPHSLQGGSMNNKVVSSMAKAFNALGIATIRFNFRGVGLSSGHYDAGIGESEDMALLMDLCKKELPMLRFIVAGFSFGSYVAYRAAFLRPVDLLISIAPPVHHYDYKEYQNTPRSWDIIIGEEDEIVPVESVKAYVETCKSKPSLTLLPDTGHFFHGKLLAVKAFISQKVSERILSL